MCPYTGSEPLGLQELDRTKITCEHRGALSRPSERAAAPSYGNYAQYSVKVPRLVRMVSRNSAMLDSTVVLMVGLCHTLGLVHHVLVCLLRFQPPTYLSTYYAVLTQYSSSYPILSSFTTEKTYTRSALFFFILLIDCITTRAPSYTFGVSNNSER